MIGAINLKSWVVTSAVLLAMWCTAAAGGKIIYVDADANCLNDGSSWENAYKYLQDALADANASEKTVEIRVAHGVYRPDEDTLHPDGTGDREATFQLINGVTLKGGYAGLGEPDPNARGINLYETILCGDLDSNDVDVNDPWNLATEPTRAENSYHIVMSLWGTSDAILDGFTITGGYANDPVLPHLHDVGGGMFNCSSPMIMNCTIVGNYAQSQGGGTGVADCGGGGRFIRCKIIDNAAGRTGGAASASFYDSIRFSNCVIANNRAGVHGGGIYSGFSRIEANNCTFSRNRALTGKGGAIYCLGSELIRIYNSILWGTTATTGGPEIAMIGTNSGSARNHPGHRAHWIGQNDDAVRRVVATRSESAQYHDRRGPDRVRFGRHQPDADQHAHRNELRARPAHDPASGSRCDHDRRNPRPGNSADRGAGEPHRASGVCHAAHQLGA